MEHKFSRRVGVVEGEGRLLSKGGRVSAEGDNIDAVIVIFNEATNRDSLVWRSKRRGGREGHGVDWVRGIVRNGVFGSQAGFLSGVIHLVVLPRESDRKWGL